MGRQDPRPRVRGIVARVAPEVAGRAADAFVPGASLGVRVVLAAIDEVRFAEIAGEAIVQTVLASAELCDDPLLTYESAPGGFAESVVIWTTPWLTLRQLAAAIGDGTFAPTRKTDTPAMYTSTETSRRWSRVADDLERARRTFVAELGGSYLLPKEGAAAVARIRTKLRAAVELARACDRHASRLAGLDMSGGLPRYVDRALGDLTTSSVGLMFALDDILTANDELVAAARRVIPEQIDELFALPDPAAAAAEKTHREREAAAEVLDNARQALVDAGEELNEWRAHASLRDAADVDLSAIADADLHFDLGHEANGWLTLGNVIDSARERFEALTSAIALELPDDLAGLRKRFIGQLNAAYGAAGEIQSRYWQVEEMKRRGKVEPLDVDGVKTRRARFHEAAKGACKTVEELGTAVALKP